MNSQEMFDTVVNHLRQQGKKALGIPNVICEGGQCSYRGENGTKCAVGCLILDSEYHSSMEGKNIRALVDPTDTDYCPSLALRLDGCVALLSSLQNVHDLQEVPEWEECFQRVAEQYKLQYTHG